MFGLNLDDNLDDFPNLPDLHNFLDFGPFEALNNNTMNSDDLNFIQDPVSPVIFDHLEQPAPVSHQPFTFYQTLAYTGPTEFSYTISQPNIESLVSKRAKRQKKKKIETRKILATAECTICLEDMKKSKIIIT